MKKDSTISLHDFMDTFIASCLINGHTVLNVDILDHYLKDLFGDEYHQNIINEYIGKKVLIPVKYFEYILNINNVDTTYFENLCLEFYANLTPKLELLIDRINDEGTTCSALIRQMAIITAMEFNKTFSDYKNAAYKYKEDDCFRTICQKRM